MSFNALKYMSTKEKETLMTTRHIFMHIPILLCQKDKDDGGGIRRFIPSLVEMDKSFGK